METDATRMCALLVGLPDVNVLGVDDTDPAVPIRVHVETTVDTMGCGTCGTRARVKDRRLVTLIDLACFGRPSLLVWHKRRWSCLDTDCPVGSFTEIDSRIAAPRSKVTDRAGRWATAQVGRDGRSVAGVARDLGCDWHTVMDAVTAYGTPLIEDPNRIATVTALGLDETLFRRTGPFNTREWATSIVDVNTPVQLLDMVEGRAATPAIDWLEKRSATWRNSIVWGALDMSGPYRKVFNDALPHAGQVADRFHVVKAANHKLDECRRRIQNETHGHRGRKDDPLYRGRRLFTKAHERLDDNGEAKLIGFLEAGDPRGELRLMWHAKEVLRGFYEIADPVAAEAFLDDLINDASDDSQPVELRSPGKMLATWRTQILNWHRSKISNGPTESANNLIKRIKRVAFGFRRFAHYRIRALLYAGPPNWDLLDTITPR